MPWVALGLVALTQLSCSADSSPLGSLSASGPLLGVDSLGPSGLPQSTLKESSTGSAGSSSKGERSVPRDRQGDSLVLAAGGAGGAEGAGMSPLSGGAGGYVEHSPPSTIPLRLCFWNIKKLGHGELKNTPLLAQVLEEQCDATVVVEVMQKQRGSPGYTALRTALGESWTAIVTDTPRPNTTSGNSEFYAIFWRKGRLSRCDGWEELRYITDNDGSLGGVGENRFVREPAYGCFEMVGPEGRFDFLLAAYHATWASGSVRTIQAEVQNIDGALAEMKNSRPGENDIFIFSDYNLVPKKLAEVTTLIDHTEGTGSTLNSQGERTSNLYDHLLVSSLVTTPELGDKAEVLDVREVSASNAIFFSTVSDHLPLRVLLTLQGRDDD